MQDSFRKAVNQPKEFAKPFQSEKIPKSKKPNKPL